MFEVVAVEEHQLLKNIEICRLRFGFALQELS